MITKYKKHHRIIATIFLLIFFPTLVPANLFASNNGPVAPEATSFEPVDAVDMVNLATGDMSYVLPLLNVPSPEGGYPLALSNHAGIAIDQEASWVGLGWSLNPGAINRAITGIPDDWKDTNINQIVYDAGGETKTYSVGLSVGWGKGAYSVGLYGSYSENKTFGGPTSHSTDGGISGSLGAISASVGTDGTSVGLSMGQKESSYGGSLNVNQSFKNGSTNISASFGYNLGGKENDYLGASGSSLGISFNSKGGLSASVGAQGFQLSGNKNSRSALNISTQSYNIPIQIYSVNISLGFSKARYWAYENNFTKYNGSLYAGNMVTSYANDNFSYTLAFDSYNSIYKLKSDEQLDSDNLSSIAYDNYSVSGQGISGSFGPSLFEQGSLINNYKMGSTNNSTVSYKNGTYDSFSKTIDNSSNDIHFYFDNESSSFLKVSSGNWSILTNPSLPIEQISPPKPYLIQNGTTTIDGTAYNGYNSTTKRKRTGSYIETFTNKEINDSNSSIIINPENYNRSNAPAEGIGAFKITSLDGKIYHYSIPVYQKEQFTRSTDLNSNFSNRYYEKQQLKPYATHWLLTAITGPDYVDINSNNKVDQGDYGYWTSFDYGKWSDGYVWSTPIKSNDKIKSYEWGVKEIYYLDKIKTRTHTALFIKEEKKDDLSHGWQVGNNENDLAWIEKISRSYTQGKDGQFYYSGIYNNNIHSGIGSILEGNYGQFIKFNTHKTLKLSKILLLKNENSTINKVNLKPISSTFKGQIKFSQQFYEWNLLGQLVQNISVDPHNPGPWYGEFYNNVYDTGDVTPSLLQSTIKTIKFNYDNVDPLAKNSTNSNAASKGRLTLSSVQFLGKNSSQILPPYKFKYINDVSYNSTMEDNWGYYKNRPDAWSLNKVITPTGAEINIAYEADDIDKEAVTGTRDFDGALQFTFFNYNNKLRIKVESEYGPNNNINFQDFFQVGTTSLDLWASYKRDYRDWECKTNKASIDINNDVSVISVASNNMILETDMSVTYNDHEGLYEFFGKIVGLNNHPDMIIDNWGRGEFGEPPGCDGPSPRLVIKYTLGGNKSSLSQTDKNGGGIRVKEISISENGIKKNTSKYFYNVPGYDENKTDANYKSSGITSFVPQKYFKEIKYITELPSPGVMYEFVTIKNYSATNSLGTIEEYNFNVLKPDISTVEDNLILSDILEITKDQTLAFSGSNNINYSRYSIKDMTSALGRLNQKKVFNNNLQLISHEQYNFKNRNNIYQGISEESFNTYKKVNNNNGYVNYRLGITSKIEYPNLLESTSIKQGGYTNNIFYDKYDFLTGQLIESHSVSSDGQSFKTKVVPAYIKYLEMGAKADDVNNKNMLSQTAISYSYIQESGNWKETGVGITTWSNVWKYYDIEGNSTIPSAANEQIWRKHKTYVWNGVKDANGIFLNYNKTSGSKDDNFDWTIGIGTQPAQWKQTSELTLYDHYSASLETKDINGNFASTKMGDNDSKVMATGNAGYNEMFYSGAENITGTDNGIGTKWLESGIHMINTYRNSSVYHTGEYSIQTTSSSKFGVFMKNGQHRPGKYKVTVWAHKQYADKAVIKANGNTVNFTETHDVGSLGISDPGEAYDTSWVLMSANVDVTSGDFSIYVTSMDDSPVIYDDLMIRPVSSSITGYVYNWWNELSYIIGNNGLATRFEYDDAGRLIKTYSEVIDDPVNSIMGGFKLSKTNTYYNRHIPSY